LRTVRRLGAARRPERARLAAAGGQTL